ncbi:MAG: hypothetical protein H6813_02775 [Phycisphaeraceae bacterium]|nr:hypothetical protein [Phycisphaeraceae bacterium]MCB9848759.1 hypothetical protein [Phycisphaeraceae bacterium]
MTTALLWNDYKYMPYEKRLATLEVARLLGVEPQPTPDGLVVDRHVRPSIAKRLTYFSAAVSSAGKMTPTDQHLFESTSRGRNGSTSGRQSTRYSAHGLHEYRGKFNPQIVRAVVNILGLRGGSLLLDPFCGSGTVLLESAHLGHNAIGFDLHPLAVEIANSKITAYRTSRRTMRRAINAVRRETEAATAAQESGALGEWLEHNYPEVSVDRLPNADYLMEWFPSLALRQLAFLLAMIERAVPSNLHSVFRMLVSDIVRDTSWQEPADLRIRRRAEPADNYPVISLFKEKAEKAVGLILAMPEASSDDQRQLACYVDSRQKEDAIAQLNRAFPRRRVDAVITSPPYATALPYVDMHRLSLCLLGLISNAGIRSAERALVGNREIGTRERDGLDRRIQENAAELPKLCNDLCRRMLAEAQRPGNGFRRRNTPALLYKYLEEMRETFRTLGAVLKPGAPAALVVGPNRCSLGGIDFVIDTPDLLRELAEQTGLATDECIELNTYQRYDIHSQNSIRREVLLVVRRARGSKRS